MKPKPFKVILHGEMHIAEGRHFASIQMDVTEGRLDSIDLSAVISSCARCILKNIHGNVSEEAYKKFRNMMIQNFIHIVEQPFSGDERILTCRPEATYEH